MAFCAWCGNHVPQVSYAACPRCGNPANGAQRVGGGVGSRGGTNTAAIVIGIVAGGFFLIAIIGILAAIAIPNLLTATQRSKQKRTIADIRSVATAAEAYATDRNEYPKASSVAELAPALVPTYIRVLPTDDGWGTPLKYECWSDGSEVCSNYAVGSAGADRTWEHESLREYAQGPNSNVNADLVYRNGTLISYPEGMYGATR